MCDHECDISSMWKDSGTRYATNLAAICEKYEKWSKEEEPRAFKSLTISANGNDEEELFRRKGTVKRFLDMYSHDFGENESLLSVVSSTTNHNDNDEDQDDEEEKSEDVTIYEEFEDSVELKYRGFPLLSVLQLDRGSGGDCDSNANNTNANVGSNIDGDIDDDVLSTVSRVTCCGKDFRSCISAIGGCKKKKESVDDEEEKPLPKRTCCEENHTSIAARKASVEAPKIESCVSASGFKKNGSNVADFVSIPNINADDYSVGKGNKSESTRKKRKVTEDEEEPLPKRTSFSVSTVSTPSSTTIVHKIPTAYLDLIKLPSSTEYLATIIECEEKLMAEIDIPHEEKPSLRLTPFVERHLHRKKYEALKKHNLLDGYDAVYEADPNFTEFSDFIINADLVSPSTSSKM